MDGAAKGLGFALVSAATFGLSGSFASSLLVTGWSPGATVTARVALAALLLLPFAVRAVQGRRLPWARLSRTCIAFGLLGVATAQLCFFQAVERLPVGVALLLEYSGALLVVGWLWLRHQQRPRRLTVAGAAVSVVGLLLVLDLVGDTSLDLLGVAWGLGAAVGLAAYFLLSAQQHDDLPPVLVACGGLLAGAVVLATAGATGVLAMRTSSADVVLLDASLPWYVPLVGLALFAGSIAYATGIAGARLLGAKVASFVGLTEVLFAVAFALVLLGQRLSPWQLLGGVAVVAGIALVRVDELRGAPAETPEPLPVAG